MCSAAAPSARPVARTRSSDPVAASIAAMLTERRAASNLRRCSPTRPRWSCPRSIPTRWRRPGAAIPRRPRPALQRWVEHTVGAGAVVSDVGEPGNGMSSETALFTVTHPDGRAERLVARLAPSPDVYPVFQTYDLAMQQGCMDLVRERTTAPAPVCRWLETDTVVAGHAVPRDGAHRRRGTGRHPALRVRRLGHGRDAPSSGTRWCATRSPCSRRSTASIPPTPTSRS